jgi:hypothetical protein
MTDTNALFGTAVCFSGPRQFMTLALPFTLISESGKGLICLPSYGNEIVTSGSNAADPSVSNLR